MRVADGSGRPADLRRPPDEMLARLIGLLDGKRLTHRELDSVPFDPTWILSDFPLP